MCEKKKRRERKKERKEMEEKLKWEEKQRNKKALDARAVIIPYLISINTK